MGKQPFYLSVGNPGSANEMTEAKRENIKTLTSVLLNQLPWQVAVLVLRNLANGFHAKVIGEMYDQDLKVAEEQLETPPKFTVLIGSLFIGIPNTSSEIRLPYMEKNIFSSLEQALEACKLFIGVYQWGKGVADTLAAEKPYKYTDGLYIIIRKS